MTSKTESSEANDEQRSNGLVRCSSSQLGELASEGFCPRCFYYKLKLHGKSTWPGISDISTHFIFLIRKTIHAFFDEHGRLPLWLAPIGEISRYHQPPHWTRFNTVIDGYGILLTGVADGIFERADGSFDVVDFQFGSEESRTEAILPVYELQLNAKSLIAERCGFSPVAGTYLVVLDPCGFKCGPTIGGFDDSCLRLSVRVHKFSAEQCSLKPYLERVRRIHGRTREPRGRRGCMECMVLQRLFRVHARSR